jgi:hypothetical protein
MDYLKSDTIGLESTVWSPCGAEGLLNIKSSIGIIPVGTSKPALLTVSSGPHVSCDIVSFFSSNISKVDSADLKYKQYYHLQWRRCNQK